MYCRSGCLQFISALDYKHVTAVLKLQGSLIHCSLRYYCSILRKLTALWCCCRCIWKCKTILKLINDKLVEAIDNNNILMNLK